MAVRTRKFKIKIDKKWCKGCELCVAFCPKNALTMKGDKPEVINPDACTGCQLCEIYCPDFAIKVVATKNTEDE